MTQHTPSPWSVHPKSPMAVHQPEFECWIPQNEADARLIAAAPDLLACLQSAVKSLEWATAVIKDIPPKSEYMEGLREARAAIAKATEP